MNLTDLAQLGINGPPPPPEDEDKKKRLNDILGEIGLHPAQIEARKSLGIGSPNGDVSESPQPGEENRELQLIDGPQQDTSMVKAAEPRASISAPTPARSALIQDPQIENARNSVLGSQNEAQRLIKTGSGISQIKNPFLRGIARAGDIALSSFFPAISMNLPGTELHHDRLYQAEQANITHGLAEEDKAAQTYDRLDPAEGKNPTALSLWVKQHPNGKIEDFWKEYAASQGVGKTPEEQLYNYLTTEGKMNPKDAYTTVLDIKNKEKPDNAAKHKQDMEALLQRGIPDMQPDDLADVRKLAKSIQRSPYLNPAEKAQLTSWYAMNASPASQGMSANIRGLNLKEARVNTYLDTKTRQQVSMNADDFNEANDKEPGRYVESRLANPVLQKESIFKDIYYQIDNTKAALKEMAVKGQGFSMSQRAQLALLLRSSDPQSALGPFFNSQIGQTLTPEQQDYVIGLMFLQENALALRTLAGFGAGSDELRAAILKTLPGAGTPNAEFADKQMTIFKGTVDRLHTGVPQLSPADNDPAAHQPAKTSKGTISRAKVEAMAKANGISYEAAKKDAEAHNYEVTE